MGTGMAEAVRRRGKLHGRRLRGGIDNARNRGDAEASAIRETEVTKANAAPPGKSGSASSETHWARLRMNESSGAMIRTADRNCDFLVFIIGKILKGGVCNPASYRKSTDNG